MATTGIVSGTFMRLSVEATNVARATNCKFNMKNDLRETTHKDNSGGATNWKTSAYGDYSGTLSSDFLVEEVAGGLSALSALFLAGTTVDFIYGTGVTGDIKFSGEAVISEIDIDATVKENAKASIKLETTGTVTKGTFA